jgi:hypothetical protein
MKTPPLFLLIATLGFLPLEANDTVSAPTAQTNQATAADIESLRQKAEQGDAESQLKLGFCYRNGISVPKDEEQAVSWYRKSADQGDAAAKKELARLSPVP